MEEKKLINQFVSACTREAITVKSAVYWTVVFILWGQPRCAYTEGHPWLNWERYPRSLPAIHHWFLIPPVNWAQWGVLTAHAPHTLNPCPEVYAALEHESSV